MTHQPNPWLPLARPVIARLDRNWRDEERALAGISMPETAVFSAEHLGFVERRKHWLTRRSQLRLTIAAITSNKLSGDLAQRGGFA